LYKLIDTYKVIDLTPTKHIEREMILAKVSINTTNRSEVIEIADIFRSKIVDVSEKSMTIEITGDNDKNEGFINLLKKFGILEIVRTGTIAIQRGTGK